MCSTRKDLTNLEMAEVFNAEFIDQESVSAKYFSTLVLVEGL